MQAGSNNVFPESVEEKTNAEQWEFSCTTFHLTLQTTTLHEQKHLNNILKIKNSKLTFRTLTGERVTSPNGGSYVTTKWQVKYPLCLTSYIHKQRPAIFGPLWFLAGHGNPQQSVFSKENYRFGTRFNSEPKAFEA